MTKRKMVVMVLAVAAVAFATIGFVGRSFGLRDVACLTGTAAAAGCNSTPYCDGGCAWWKPCDKVCRNSDESCSTCGDFGLCDGAPPPAPTPTPIPSPDCTDPVIFTNPNPARDANGDGMVTANLAVANNSNDILPYSFVWDFGDGHHNSTALSGSHSYPVRYCEEVRNFTVYWEGWCRRNDGTDRFITATTNLEVRGACVSGGPDECLGGCNPAF